MAGGPVSNAEAREYSSWLGPISRDQFQAALARFDLGDFVEAAPVREGLFGQNVFVTSTRGRFVFRGRPRNPGQFSKERFAVDLLHEGKRVPVAHPYLVEEAPDVFGWPWVLMPLLPGINAMDKSLTVGEQIWVARAIGQNLAALHEHSWPFAGEYDLATNTIQPFGGGLAEWFAGDARRRLSQCLKQGFVTPAEAEWAERIIGESAPALTGLTPCFVMGDYYASNLLVACHHGEWRVTGLVDLPAFHFGAGETDLVRAASTYLDISAARKDEPRLARAFATAYLEARPPGPGFVERYRLTMLRDRLVVWDLVGRGKLPAIWPAGKGFREINESHIESHRLLVPPGK